MTHSTLTGPSETYRQSFLPLQNVVLRARGQKIDATARGALYSSAICFPFVLHLCGLVHDYIRVFQPCGPTHRVRQP